MSTGEHICWYHAKKIRKNTIGKTRIGTVHKSIGGPRGPDDATAKSQAAAGPWEVPVELWSVGSNTVAHNIQFARLMVMEAMNRIHKLTGDNEKKAMVPDNERLNNVSHSSFPPPTTS
ncbi:hypothetical protein B9K05_13635 [Acetobacter syzygii]|uniref:Uncharacterized protein n=1 Tax=Acetobacter syzygii TaxID=146476 RepID=A0A270B4K1_9PROT|nr:hypothetical protein B9K05_13635 [Acetobacter syzygii]PAL20041.1 hypothetical protein B9K04_13600 [Acetobacter syzygii]